MKNFPPVNVLATVSPYAWRIRSSFENFSVQLKSRFQETTAWRSVWDDHWLSRTLLLSLCPCVGLIPERYTAAAGCFHNISRYSPNIFPVSRAMPRSELWQLSHFRCCIELQYSPMYYMGISGCHDNSAISLHILIFGVWSCTNNVTAVSLRGSWCVCFGRRCHILYTI